MEGEQDQRPPPQLLGGAPAENEGEAEEENANGSSTTPLLFLLDGVLSHDVERVSQAMEEIRAICPPLLSSLPTTTESESPCFNTTILLSVLDGLLHHRPDLAAVRSHHDGSLPLHFAASLGNVPVASLILSKFPEAARAPNNKGKIPLHYAAREGREAMVHFFLETVPDTATIATDKGKLAVHFSAGEGHVNITNSLLHCYPQSASMASAKGKLPLHFCARWGYLEIAQKLLRVYPEAVRALDWEGSLPLHDAAREGQCRMARYLIERFPGALQTANLRGEIPLFPAVRSANVDLVTLMIQAFPRGGKHILANVSADDNVDSWNSEILELLLRGSVNNLRGCTILDGREPPTVRLTDDVAPAAPSLSAEELKAQKKARKRQQQQTSSGSESNDKGPSHPQPRLVPVGFTMGSPSSSATASQVASVSPATMLLPVPVAAAAAAATFRSKSPILSSNSQGSSTSSCRGSISSLDCRKKHGRKRSRSQLQEDPSSHILERTYIPIHAALESKASSHVIERVLREHPEDCGRADERGRMCLHWAVTHCCQQQEVVQLVLDRERYPILTEQAACTIDQDGRLPLHLAIENGAHVSVIQALLEANPAGGVEPCRTRDRFHDQAPIHMAMFYDCDLSTIFELVRVDPSVVSREKAYLWKL